MNSLTTAPTSHTASGAAPSTMSSREIAELTGKRHDNVMFDIRTMLTQLEIATPEFSGTALVPGPNNSTRTVAVFNLPKDLTITLVSGYNVVMRHRIVTRWQELEASSRALQVPQNYGEALRLAAENWERAQVAEVQALTSPKFSGAPQ